MGVRLTHVGGPTVLLEVDGWRILTDPTFDPPGRRYAFGWGTSSTKAAGPAVAVEDVGPIDAVLLTHDHHADNLDDRGRGLLREVPTVITTRQGARRLGGSAIGLTPWTITRLEHPRRATIAVRATPCRHGPALSRPIVGDVIGFALTVEGQGRGALWISGDTVWFGGLRQIAHRVDVDVAVLHLGGVRFPITGPLRYTMTARQGMRLCAALGPRLVVPVHYEGWSHFRDGPDALRRELARQPPAMRSRFRLPSRGTPLDIEPDPIVATRQP